jgi:hypothetical protein
VDIGGFPFHYMIVEYTNNFGSGQLTAVVCARAF